MHPRLANRLHHMEIWDRVELLYRRIYRIGTAQMFRYRTGLL